MGTQRIIFSKIDRVILNSYKTMLQGLADYLGEGYEIVLHSLESLEHSVIFILNGHHTGRKEGAPITDLALSMLDEISKGKKDYITYFSKNRNGEPLKSATIAIRGEKDKIIGLVCINFYMNTSLYDIINCFVPKDQLSVGMLTKENFVENSDDLIEDALNQAKMAVYADQTISAANKNKAIIYMLESKGVFNIKDSVIKIADLLNISKNTVYMHLRNKNS
jgi:predicted transcriptional regulator YheO